MTTTPMIINALGQLDNPNAPRSSEAAAQLNPSSEQLTIDARTLADAHASGLTAVNITLGYTMGDLPPYEHTLHEIAVWDAIIRDNPADLTKVRTVADVHRARKEGRIGVIYGFQNAVAVGEDTGRIATFADLGVRVVQLTYNQANHIGDGSMAAANRGLSDFGRRVVEALGDHHLMVDLSTAGNAPAWRPRRSRAVRCRSTTRGAGHWPTCRATRPTRNSGWWPRAAASWASTSCPSSTSPVTPVPRTSSSTSTTR